VVNCYFFAASWLSPFYLLPDCYCNLLIAIFLLLVDCSLSTFSGCCCNQYIATFLPPFPFYLSHCCHNLIHCYFFATGWLFPFYLFAVSITLITHFCSWLIVLFSLFCLTWIKLIIAIYHLLFSVFLSHWSWHRLHRCLPLLHHQRRLIVTFELLLTSMFCLLHLTALCSLSIASSSNMDCCFLLPVDCCHFIIYNCQFTEATRTETANITPCHCCTINANWLLLLNWILLSMFHSLSTLHCCLAAAFLSGLDCCQLIIVILPFAIASMIK